MATSSEARGARQTRRFRSGVEEFFMHLALTGLVIGAMVDTALKLGPVLV